MTCPNSKCTLYDQSNRANIRLHSFYKLKSGGKRRRFRCTCCGKTFCIRIRSPYYRLHLSPIVFDEAAHMSVEGISKSAIARIKGVSWNTVSRWLELAAQYSRSFSEKNLNGYELIELQADEIQTFVGRKNKTTWIFTTLEVWSRLWPSFLVGRRSYKNTKEVIKDTLKSARIVGRFLFTTDGFGFYKWAATKLFGIACIHGQVIKKWRKNRVTQVERKLIIGSDEGLAEALLNSEDSEKINTSFVERHNLTIRRGCSYLNRKTPCHARDPGPLVDQLDLLKTYYNFIRPHRALKFGKLVKTPAMQAGICQRKLSFREIFAFQSQIFWSLYFWVQIRMHTPVRLTA